MKTNPDDCIFIKKYNRQLTDTAIKKIRDSYSKAIEFKEIWDLEDHDGSFKFINPNNGHESLVSFNHVDQMSCDCPWFVNHRLACPHMLIILDQTMPQLRCTPGCI